MGQIRKIEVYFQLIWWQLKMHKKFKWVTKFIENIRSNQGKWVQGMEI